MLFRWPLAKSFSGSYVYDCAFMLADACPSSGILLPMSHSCLLRLHWVHHTYLMCVTHQSYRKCVFPFTSLPLFPINSTKENVIHSQVLPDWNFLSTFKWISEHHGDSEKMGKPFELWPFIEFYLNKPIPSSCWRFSYNLQFLPYFFH